MLRFRSVLPQAALILLLAFAAGCRHSHDSSSVRDIQQLSTEVFRSGVPTAPFVSAADPDNAGRQLSDNWCWAAASQMILNYHGVAITQSDLVKAMYGSLVDRTATTSQVANLLNGAHLKANGQAVVVKAQAYSYAPSKAIIDLLTYNQPLILGLTNPNGSAHAYVMTSVDWSTGATGPLIQKVTLRDPWPSDVSEQVLNASDVSSRILGVVLLKVGAPDDRGNVQWPSTSLPAASPDTSVALGGLGADQSCAMPADALFDDAKPSCADWQTPAAATSDDAAAGDPSTAVQGN